MRDTLGMNVSAIKDALIQGRQSCKYLDCKILSSFGNSKVVSYTSYGKIQQPPPTHTHIQGPCINFKSNCMSGLTTICHYGKFGFTISIKVKVLKILKIIVWCAGVSELINIV